MKHLLFILFLLFINWSAAAEAVDVVELENQAAFTDANQDFEKGRELSVLDPEKAQKSYQLAILKYEQLAERSACQTDSLYENLGNAYVMVGDRGRGILNYHRSLSRGPLNENVLHSLEYLRSENIDVLELTSLQKLKQVVLFWHRWPIWVRVVVFTVLHVAFWVLLTFRVINAADKKKYSGKHRFYLYGTAVCSVAFGLSLLASQWRWGNPVDAVIIEKEITARQGNGLIYDNAFTTELHAGLEFRVLEKRGEWFHAELLNGDRCWLPERAVELVLSE